MAFRVNQASVTGTVKWDCHKTGVKSAMFHTKKRLHFYERVLYFIALSEVFVLYVVSPRIIHNHIWNSIFRSCCKSFMKLRSHGTKFWPGFLEKYKIGSAKLKTSYLSTYISACCKDAVETAQGKGDV
jgi:hypothetical protein